MNDSGEGEGARHLRELDELCDTFEQQLRTGGKPNVDSYVQQASPDIQNRLREELNCLLDSYRSKKRASGASTANISATLPIAQQEGDEPSHVRRQHGSRVSRYQFRGPMLASGGLSEIYNAYDSELGRHVALKRLKPTLATNEQCRDLLVREAEITGRLQHPGVLPIYGLGILADGTACYAMPWIHGKSLRDCVAETHENFSPESFRSLIRSFIDICDTIHYAHSQGILHRDIKPDNILVGNYGETRVIDWGFAWKMGDESSVMASATNSVYAIVDQQSEGGPVVGTPRYMSPEQASGNYLQLGIPTDVYSLGATLYTILTGKPPFHDEDAVHEIVRKTKTTEPPQPRSLRKDVPAPLNSICAKAMAKATTDRYASVNDLSTDVERWLADEPVSAHRDSLVDRIGRLSRRRRNLAAGFGISLLVTAVASLIVTYVTIRERSSAIQSAEEKQQMFDFLIDTFRASEGTYSFDELVFRRPKDDTRRPSDLLKQAAVNAEQRFQGDPALKSSFLGSIGAALVSLGFFEGASEVLGKALESVSDDDRETRATLLHRRACALFALGNRTEAETLYREALDLRLDLYGEQDERTTTTMYWLGFLLAQGKQAQEEARDILSRVVVLRRAMRQSQNEASTEGASYQGEAIACVGLAAVQLSLEEYEQAARNALLAGELFSRSKEPAAKKLGQAIQLYQLAAQRTNRFSKFDRESAADLANAIDTIEAFFGSEHPYLAWIYFDYSGLLEDSPEEADQRKSLEFMRKTLRLALRNFGADSAHTLDVKSRLTFQELNFGDLNTAAQLADEMVIAAEKQREREPGQVTDIRFADRLYGHGLTRYLRGEYVSAQSSFERALQVLERYRAKAPVDVGFTVWKSAWCDIQLDQVDEAAAKARAFATSPLYEQSGEARVAIGCCIAETLMLKKDYVAAKAQLKSLASLTQEARFSNWRGPLQYLLAACELATAETDAGAKRISEVGASVMETDPRRRRWTSRLEQHLRSLADKLEAQKVDARALQFLKWPTQ